MTLMEAFKGKKKGKVIALPPRGSESIKKFNEEEDEKRRAQPRIKDDVSEEGRIALARRKIMGRNLNDRKNTQRYRAFGGIETLPMLPERSRAEAMLRSLSNDPGVVECMRRRGWKVGRLCEMFPEGKVGVSEVCVMGLNVNKGQKILLRLRTDDLRGFRKMESVRKVLFHELSHNDISEHNGEFFKLMRQVESECNSMNWKSGAGSALGSGAAEADLSSEMAALSRPFQGGSGRLGGGSAHLAAALPARDLAANAAYDRLSKEEADIVDTCGCSRVHDVLSSLRATESGPPGEGDAVLYDEGGGVWKDATVVKVHYDDGPDEPYYTIKFSRSGEEVEKQTTAGRLRRRDEGGGEE